MNKYSAVASIIILTACSVPNDTAPVSSTDTASTKARHTHGSFKPSGGGQYVYSGCGVFPPGDIFNHDTAGYTNDPNTSKQFSKAPAGSFAYWDDQSNETVTAAPSTTFMSYTVQPQSGGHQPPLENSATMPFNVTAADNIQGGDNGGYPNNQYPHTDGHAVVLETDTCSEYETFGTSFAIPSGPLAAYSGRQNILNETWSAQLVNDANAITAGGIPLLPSTYWGEDATATGNIHHIGSFMIFEAGPVWWTLSA